MLASPSNDRMYAEAVVVSGSEVDQGSPFRQRTRHPPPRPSGSENPVAKAVVYQHGVAGRRDDQGAAAVFDVRVDDEQILDRKCLGGQGQPEEQCS